MDVDDYDDEEPYEEDGRWAEHEGHEDECLQLFTAPDYIMESDICAQIGRYFRANGPIEQLVQLLSTNYVGIAQMVNLLAEWLIQAGIDIKDVQDMVEQHLLNMIFKYFDPKKADSIFTDSGETPPWLVQMIDFQTWRNLFYKLAELISDAGHQGEITSVSTACHQLEVFSRVLRTFISTFLEGGEDVLEKILPEFNRMVCHGEHTYLYSQLVMNILSQEQKGGANIRRLCQEVNKSAKSRGLDVTPIILLLSGASQHPETCQALSSMLSRNELNPADITVLYKWYSSNNPPPAELIRSPQFLDLFLDALFKPGSQINPEHKSKYIYILSYASCVVEVWKKGVRRSVNREELESTISSLEEGHMLCSEIKTYTELLADVNSFFHCIKSPVVSMGIIKWIYATLTKPGYFLTNTEHTPLHLILLDEIATNHPLLHKNIFQLLVQLFEFQFADIDDIFRLNLKKTILDRLVHLISCGYVLPVISFIHDCWKGANTDVSLIRHFVTELLDMIAPPYSPEFVQAFYPMIESKDITGSLRQSNENDPISEFISNC
ncbi:hypothetical protein HELRODRAFT_157967 [Helobdella robusta]|uniref:Negative elongation factor C/D n=1 Tax=Helobdella robusta TaxID=6412 RepID=T1EMI2_HELRO|nr:hypothetical protein HELRODRAFT_157967 [Helobdella robusta]ESN92288.1 hypothetical protein HELRODRAFT_157967 [Helobdella robusta]